MMDDTHKDPVCGAKVDSGRAIHEQFGRRRLCFCSERCRTQFLADPQPYLRRIRKSTTVF